MRRNDDLIFVEPLEIRDAYVQIGISACNARSRRMGKGRGATGSDDSPLGAGKLSQSLADAMASRTSGRINDPPTIVNVPRQLISGRTPID